MRGVVSVEEYLKGIGVYLYYAVVDRVVVVATPEPLSREIERIEDYVRSSFRDAEMLTAHPVVQAYRRLLWRLGVDPTKLRPSGEALARRVVNGGRIPRINSVVDSGNLVSLKTLVPIGIYDLDRLETPVTLRRAAGSEVFRPIGGRERRVKQGTPIMVDGRGVVIHIYPHRDSEETMVRGSTRRLLIVGCGAPGVPKDLVRRSVAEVVDLLSKYSGASGVFQVEEA